jgi:hypothetical protein
LIANTPVVGSQRSSYYEGVVTFVQHGAPRQCF